MHKTVAGAVLVTVLAGSASTRAACIADLAEPDDSCFTSKAVLQGGQVIARNLCEDATDWTRFNACAGRTYTIRTLGLGSAADPVIEVYAPDCSTLLASDDNGGGGAASLLNWTAPADGVFHLTIRQANGSSGDDRAYDVELIGNTSTCATWASRYDAPPDTDAFMQYFGAIADGGFIASGVVFSDLSEAWIARMDAGGRVAWQRQFGNPNADAFGLETVQTADGGFALWGQFSDRPWVVKLDAAATVQWQRSYDAAGSQLSFRDAYATPDGGLILVGQVSAPYDIWLLKLTAAGAVEWSKKYGGGSYDDAFVVAATADGGFLVVGNTQSFGPSGHNGWVLKLGASGDIIWQKAYGGLLSDQLTALALTTDGGALVAGGSESFTTEYAMWVMLLNAAGTIVWQKTYSGSHNDTASLTATSDGGFAIGAQYFENADFDGRLLRIDAAGNVLWNKRDFTPSEQSVGVASVEETPDGGLVIWSYRGNVDSVLRANASGASPSCSSMSYEFATASDSTAVVVTTNATMQTLMVSTAVTTAVVDSGSIESFPECPCLPGVNLFVRKLPATQLVWTTGAGGWVFDVVRGNLTTLAASNGDFTTALNAVPTASVCMADDSSAFSLVDSAANPPAGQGYFYLVRAENITCNDWDDRVHQIGSRDSEIAAASGACP